MNDKIRELAEQAGIVWMWKDDVKYTSMTSDQFAIITELLIKACIDKVESSKTGTIASLDDAKRIGNFVDVAKNRIITYFGI